MSSLLLLLFWEFRKRREVHRHCSGPALTRRCCLFYTRGARAIKTNVFHCMFYARRRGLNCTVIATSHVSYTISTEAIVCWVWVCLKRRRSKNFHWRVPLERWPRVVNSEGMFIILWLCWRHFFLQKHRSYQCRDITYQCSFFLWTKHILHLSDLSEKTKYVYEIGNMHITKHLSFVFYTILHRFVHLNMSVYGWLNMEYKRDWIPKQCLKWLKLYWKGILIG